jgi:hypothetical protein
MQMLELSVNSLTNVGDNFEDGCQQITLADAKIHLINHCLRKGNGIISYRSGKACL